MKSPEENARDGVPRAALVAYERGEFPIDRLADLGQDIYEAGIISKLPPRYFLLLEHLKRIAFIHTPGRAYH